MKSPTETDPMINNSKIKMMLRMILSITTDSSTHSREPEILLKSEDHQDSTLLK